MSVSSPRGRLGLPRRISGLAAWYRPESLSALTNGAAVASWPDSSGNGRNLAQGTGANQPTYAATVAAHGGQPGVAFAGTTAQYLTATGFTGWASAVTILAVVTWNASGSANGGVCEINSGAVNTGPAILQSASSNPVFRVQSGGSKDATPTFGGPASLIVANSHDGVTSKARPQGQYVDGSVAAGAWTTNTLGTLNVGSLGGAIFPLNGTISELLIYNRSLTDAERQALVLYLTRKYRGEVAFNAPASTQLTTPTPDATGQVTHPDVTDFQNQFGIATWHGHRYWMLITPFAADAVGVENPCLLASDDGVTWVVPTGITNPLDPQPTPAHGDDPEMDYDAANDRLLCFYCSSDNSTTGVDTWNVRTYDGTTVSGETVLLTANNDGLGIASPAVQKIGSTWYAWIVHYKLDPNKIARYTASDPLGPWTFDQYVTVTGMPTGREAWHIDVIRDPRDGTLYMAMTHQPQNNWANHKFLIAVSRDNGLNWACTPTLLLPVAGGQQNDKLYRACMVLSADANSFDVWYSARSNTGVWNAWKTALPFTAAAT